MAYGVKLRLCQGAKLAWRNAKRTCKSSRESAYAAVAHVIADVYDLAASVQEQGASGIQTQRGKKMKRRQAGDTAKGPREMIWAGKADFCQRTQRQWLTHLPAHLSDGTLYRFIVQPRC